MNQVNVIIHTHAHAHMHTHKYYSEILLFMTTWMGLEGITLSEMNQIEKDKYCMVSLTTCGVLKKSQTQKHRAEKWLPGNGGWRKIGIGW